MRTAEPGRRVIWGNRLAMIRADWRDRIAPYGAAMPITRRRALGVIASTTASILGAPAILRGSFQLFGRQGSLYSARAIRLVEETIVIDMLNQFRFPDFAEKPPSSQK